MKLVINGKLIHESIDEGALKKMGSFFHSIFCDGGRWFHFKGTNKEICPVCNMRGSIE